jgi:hypothetical protein
MLSQTQANTAILDSEIDTLGANLATLHDFARSLPTGVAVPLDKRTVFAELEFKVNRQFDRLSYALAAVEGNTV